LNRRYFLGKLERGLKEAMTGIIAGIVVTAIMRALVEDGLIPSTFILLFIIVGIAGNIATIRDFRWAGTIYTIGWLIGGLLLRDVLEPIDFILYIVSPIIILALRIWQFIKTVK